MDANIIKVLIVDDDEDDYVLTQAMLAASQWRQFILEWAASYEQGLAAMQRDVHDIYLVDYRLGPRHGLDLIREAKKLGCCKGAVIMLTGLPDRELDMEAANEGVADFLIKGHISADQLERSIRYALARAETLEALRKSEWRVRATFDQAAVGIAQNGLDGRWQQVNQRLCDILGYTAEELLTMRFQDVTHPDDAETDVQALLNLLSGEIKSHTREKRYVRKDGSLVWVNRTASPVRNAAGQIEHLVAVVEDITERKRMEAKLHHTATHDALTGLPNQSLFMQRLSAALVLGSSPDNQFAVLFLDLDRFKVINDSIGHLVGDQLLVAIARRLEVCVRPGDTVARFGGDEFTLLLQGLSDGTEAMLIAERIRRDLIKPFELSGHEVYSNASIGIALSSGGYLRAEDILRDADIAMYRAKALGRARHEVFTPGMHACLVDLWHMDADLRRAIQREEFLIYYQPIVSLLTGEITSVEALLRWQHPERGMIMPEEFIPLAEETEAITVIGEWVLRKACAQTRLWHEAGYPVRLAVNFSARQFQRQNLPALVKQVLAHNRLPAHFFEMEITESIAMQNVEFGIPTLSELSNMGIRISIDDFGTGYSSLAYLQRFPVNTLKIDRSFIRDMSSRSKDTAIPMAIIAMAHGLKLQVTAEGVETQEQLAFLYAHQCDSIQGFLFSQPVPAMRLTRLLQKKRVLAQV